jgi:membrane associated rhomboid family serine protease
MSDEGGDVSHRFGSFDPHAGTVGQAPPAPAREPLTRAPWPAVALAGSILLAFLVQSSTGSVDAWNARFGLRPSELLNGDGVITLFTAMWSHANWAHAGMNAVFALAFGAAAARVFGVSAKGAALFLLFYLVGGVIASLGFASVHPDDGVVMVGASGGVSALAGAAARLLSVRARGEGEPLRLAPFTSATVVGMSFAFISANLILGLVGVNLGQGGAPLAWEAHLAGYAAGLLLIGPFAWLAGRLHLTGD